MQLLPGILCVKLPTVILFCICSCTSIGTNIRRPVLLLSWYSRVFCTMVVCRFGTMPNHWYAETLSCGYDSNSFRGVEQQPPTFQGYLRLLVRSQAFVYISVHIASYSVAFDSREGSNIIHRAHFCRCGPGRMEDTHEQQHLANALDMGNVQYMWAVWCGGVCVCVCVCVCV